MSIPLPYIEELATYNKYVCYCSTNKHLIHMEQFVSTFCSCEKQRLGLADYRKLLRDAETLYIFAGSRTRMPTCLKGS